MSLAEQSCSGVLELPPRGYGFLRNPAQNFRVGATDVYVGSHLGWGMSFGTFEKRPAFESYFERLSARPAAIRAREIDDALLDLMEQRFSLSREIAAQKEDAAGLRLRPRRETEILERLSSRSETRHRLGS